MTLQERLRQGASSCRDENVNLGFAKVADEAASRIDELEEQLAAKTLHVINHPLPVYTEQAQTVAWQRKQIAADEALMREALDSLESYRRMQDDDHPCDAERALVKRLEMK